MNTPALLFGLGSIGAALFLFRLAKQELRSKKLSAALKMTQIKNIQKGLCLTSGEVEAISTIETPYTKTPSVWYKYSATQRRHRKGHSALVEVSIASGSQSCVFFLKDDTGRIEIVPKEGQPVTYPHGRVLKSQSGSNASLETRVNKLKDIDTKNYPEGKEKPFFRKIEMEDEPLDIPNDLMELPPDSQENYNVHRKYYESWIQSGDHVFVLGTALTEGNGSSSLKIAKVDKTSPFFISKDAQDLTAKAFQNNFVVLSLIGLGLALLGVFLILISAGVIDG